MVHMYNYKTWKLIWGKPVNYLANSISFSVCLWNVYLWEAKAVVDLCPFTCQSVKSRKEINLTISWSWFWFWPHSLLHCIFLQADLSESFLLISPWRSFHGLGSAIELTGSIKLIKTFWKPHPPRLLVSRCGIFLDRILWGIGKGGVYGGQMFKC